MSKKKLIDMLILVFGYLVCASFPFGLFIGGELGKWLVPLLQIVLQIVFAVFWILFIPKSNLKTVKIKTNLKNYLFLLPAVVIVASNFLYGAFCPNDFVSEGLEWTFALNVMLTALLVTNEEFIFRYVMLGNMDKIEKPLVKVIISAGAFALCHIGYFLNTFNPADLLPVLYTFGLGIVLGMFYVYGGAPCTCICLHLMFNIVNGLAFDVACNVSNYLIYILVNCGVALVVGGYIFIIYFVRLRNQRVYNISGELI